jgi:hypothetical protein
MNKYLIIGQAPPAVKQTLPYDTTMLYTMLDWCGISKEKAQSLFEFEAMTNEFPGYSKSGHAVPDLVKMRQHYDNCLYFKIQSSDGVIVLGNVAKNTLQKFGFEHAKVAYILHPSRRNYSRIMRERESITTAIHSVIK